MNQKKRATIIFLIALSAVTLWFCYLITKPFLKPVFFAVVLAIVFHPFHARMCKVFRQGNVAALISTLGALFAIAIPAFLIGAALRKELTSVYQTLSRRDNQGNDFIPNLLHLIDRARIWLSQYVDLSGIDLRAELVDRLQQFSAFLLSQVAGFAGGVTSFIIAGVISFFTLFYLFRDGRVWWRRLAAIIPLNSLQLEKLSSGIRRTITASMYGGLAVAVAQGMLLGLAFWILGIPSPVLWGLTTAVFSFVPFVGSGIVWLPAAIILMLNGHLVKGIILLAWGAGVVGMADNVVRMIVISGHTRFHTLYVFFALLGGIQAFGIIGLFIGPVALAMAQELFNLIREEVRAQNNNGLEPTARQGPVADADQYSV